jgi:Phosphotransferase enzyme family
VSAEVAALAGALLRDRGVAARVSTHRECRGGGNNRVVRLETDAGPFVAKLYFTHEADPRDRLRSEYGFLEYARRLGMCSVPAPVAADPGQHLAVYTWIDGAPLGPGSIEFGHVQQAIAFFRALNGPSRHLAEGLPPASEACFSIAQHVRLVEGRLDRLRRMPVEEPVDHEALALVGDISRASEEVKRWLDRAAARARMDPDEPLEATDRCVSPSDFGFHNALVRANGDVVFLDFEYAGWDDPAKAIGDFFCQPQVPVDRRWFADVAEAFTAHSREGTRLVRRAQLLLPVIQVKWCLIRLNEFTPDALRRRLFAMPECDVGAIKRERLEHTRAALAAALSDLDRLD